MATADGTVTRSLRDSVKEFAQALETARRASPAGWVGVTPAAAGALLDTAVGSLDTLLLTFNPSSATVAQVDAVTDLCITIGNLAMEIRDLAEGTRYGV